jgi:hypothetical protein
MIADTVTLRFSGPARVARLRELTGREEGAVSGASSADAIELIAALLDGNFSGEEERIRAADLTAADRDRLLAAIYERAFGDRIESTLTCRQCGQPFDLHFSLRELTKTLDEHSLIGQWRRLDDGWLENADGVRFRLPDGNDELAVAGLDSEGARSALLRRCVKSGDWPGGSKAFEDLLEDLAPLINLELNATCAECGHDQAVQFDIQSYLLSAIAGERRRLLSDVHRIAAAYAWSLEEILALTRSDRRQLVELIENESSRRPRHPR